ncbi:hypothetical protein GCM10009731_10030 [Streptomyces globosus]
MAPSAESNGQSPLRGRKWYRVRRSGAVSRESSANIPASARSTVARVGTGMIHAARRAFPPTVNRITICSVRPSQRTTDVSRSTPMREPPSGIIAPQPQAYAGLISEAAWVASRARSRAGIRLFIHTGSQTTAPVFRFRPPA